MKGSSILNIKGWPKIHHPLPRTPRESQQLLSALTSSFRRQLDAADSNKPALSTDVHMQSILNNPLFRVVPSKLTYPVSESSSQQNPEKRLAEEPMAVFDDLVASGSVTSKDIARCLHYQLALIGSTSDDVKKAMRSSGAGARVVAWFWASDSISRKSFFRFRRTTSAVLKFMVAEGLQEITMAWLRMISKLDVGGLDGKIPESEGRQLFDVILSYFLEAEIRYGRGIASALDYFAQAFQICSSLTEQGSDNLGATMLKKAGTYLIQWIVEHSEEVKDVPISVYDRHCEAIAALTSMPSMAPLVWLYHPSQPTAESLLTYVGRHSSERPFTELRRDHLLRMYLDAFRLLIDQERYEDASWFAPYVRQELSGDNVKTPQKSQHAMEEDELLTRLDLALA